MRNVWIVIGVIALAVVIVVAGLRIENGVNARNAAYSEAVVRARDVRDDLTTMLHSGERYLRSGGKKDRAEYARASADLPKDVAMLVLWTGEDVPALASRAQTFLQYTQDESEMIKSSVASAQDRPTKFGPKLADALAQTIRPTDLKVDRAEQDLESAAGGLHN